jgi:hypothetical protein
MEKLKQIKAEIERLLCEQAPSHDQQCDDYEDGYICALSKIDNFIDSMMEDTKGNIHNIPNDSQKDLNEAFRNYIEPLDNHPADQGEELYMFDAFKAGAEWMGKRYEVLGETEIYLEDDGGEAPYTQEWLDLDSKEFKLPDWVKQGDKVEILIRRKEC